MRLHARAIAKPGYRNTARQRLRRAGCVHSPSDRSLPAQGSSGVKEELVAIFRRVGERDSRGLTDLYAFQEVPTHPVSCLHATPCRLWNSDVEAGHVACRQWVGSGSKLPMRRLMQ